MNPGKNSIRAFRIIYNAAGSTFRKAALLTIFQGMLPLLFIFFIKLLIDQISKTVSLSGNDAIDGVWYSTRVWFITLLVIGCFLVYLLTIAVGSYSSYVREKLSASVGKKMYSLLHEKSVSLDILYFEDPAYHDLFHRASRDITYRPNRITASLLQLLQSGVSLAVLALMLVYIHWGVAVVLLVAAVPSILVRLRFSKAFFEWTQANIRTERYISYFHRILTGEAFARELRLFGLAPLFAGRFSESHDTHYNSRLVLSRKRMFGEIVAAVISGLLVFGTIAFIIRGTLAGNISIGSLVLYFLAFQRGLGFMKETTGSLTSLYEDRLFLNDLFAFLDLKPSARNNDTLRIPAGKGEIILRNLGFTYPGSNNAAIEGLDFTMEAGKHYALVGENGAGKSTLVKLLCGLYRPSTGTICLNGTDYNEISEKELFRHFSALFQDFVLYYLTAGDNIMFGDPGKPLDKARLDKAAAEAGADELIGTFAKGWDTPLGRIMDNGRQLSMGEWQKIALARAFYRDAPILLLDEPGSAVDARAEASFIEKFHRLAAGKTTLIISHRLSAVRNTDQILVLHKGRIIETGTHDELMEKNGKYAELFTLQANSYR